ncbi:hemicentin-1 isoform X2 [Diachasmimorpha longicaudata]|uniref:hemicentin-1 isoform X2 n=1 Tax=Diachasmimorpha longicaudata TaxID=58733 RepID=UPI0030B91B36
MATSIIHLVLVQIFLAFFVNGSVEPWKKSEKTAERGSEVELPCILKSSNCRGLHSIKWYRGTQRIIIFSENAGTTHDNNDIANRTSMDYYANVTQTLLKIKNLKVEDEGLYRCEATYLTINRECNNVQHITLNVTVSPKFVKVIEKDKEAENLTSGVLLGPVNEGTNITLICESDEGKPVPIVEWYKDDQRVTASGSTDIQRNGIGTGRSVLELQVSRNELGATFVCRVSSPALAEPLTVDIGLDVHVGPLKMNVTGVVGHVVSGTKILLECKVSAARPAANVTWCNGTDILSDNNERTDVFETKTSDNSDGTFETSSYFGFTTSEYDNGQTFSCFGENSVTRAEGVKPMKEAITMEILYPPIVSMHPKNITVNETEDVVMFCEYDANPASLKSVKWYRDNQELDLTSDHYEGGLTDQPSLTVKMSNSSDMGTYKCVLTNSVGNSSDDSSIDVSILYKPSVQVIVEPEVPVNEAERLNVSLTCDVTDGNPISLNAVRWYLDGDLLKELPDCARNSTVSTTDDTSTFCDIDPSKLLLEAVGRSFHGNYSCEGRNDAGWGPISGRTSVTVHYKPGPATISYEPMRVVKGNPLNITCSVIDPGRPRITGYKWIRGIHRLTDQEKAVLSMESVNLRTKDNFTCMAYNEAGDGDSATTFIDVSAAPAFIHPLAPYHGYVYNATNVSIGCRVECSPICNVSWSKNNKPIDFSANDSLYYVTNVYHPADKGTSDFESIQSNLTWNLSAWPNGQLDRHKDNDNFTCESNGNGIGPGVRSTTHFQVEYPPENMTVSTLKISVIENTIPDSVKCSAVAHPEPTFRWYREGSPDIAASSSAVLDIKERVPRRSNGTYICEASNRHGPARISVCLDVLYKPDCQINRERINGEDYLVCSAVANPKECNFNWSLKSDNDSIDQLAEMRDGKSYLLLDTTVTNYRTYMCIANNTIDFSSPCELGVPGNIPWWFHLEEHSLIIIIIVAMVILIVIIVCSGIIYLICRRRRMQAKYSNRVVSMEEREHPDGGPPSPTDSTRSHNHCSSSIHPSPAPRWPLKPGVLVHINRTHSLSTGLSPVHARQNLQMHSTLSGCTETDQYHSQETNGVVRKPVRPFRRGKTTTVIGHLEQHHHTTGVPIVHDEGMIARANRIRAMFSSQLREPGSFPGISRDKTAVTYKRIVPRQRMSSHGGPSFSVPSRDNPRVDGCGNINANVNTNASRKRKKPGADPGQGVNNNRVDSVSEGLPDSDTKTFYDNLPFHGIQAPQNKPNNLYDYKDHYQQRHEKQKQDILQYGYSLPSSSTGQLTLPLTRSLYPSSLASHLQPSLVHTNSLCQSYSYRQEASSIIDGNGNGSVNDTFPLSMLHGDNHFDIDRTHEHQSQTRQRRNERKKYRKRERKSKHGRSSSSRETSFGKIQELGIPHTYKITHPHYFEDVSACANNQSTSYPKHNSGRDDTINNKLSKEKRAVYTENIRESTRTSPVVGQYAGLNFRDVGQEIDV